MPKTAVLGKTSTRQGASFTGERICCALATRKTGTGSKPHFHPDEIFDYVLLGALQVEMDGERFVVPTGCLLHIPANMAHNVVAANDGDATYLVWRDRAGEKDGKPTITEV